MSPRPCALPLAALLACGADPDASSGSSTSADASSAAADDSTSAADSTSAPTTTDADDTSSSGADESSSGASTGDPGTTGDDACAATRAAIEAVAVDYRDTLALTGLAVGAQTPGCAAWSQAWGAADLAAQAALTPDHVLRAGSLTKSFTAALLLKLAEDGLLTLDDTLAQWGIQGVPAADEISLRQLLHHTSGLNDYQYSAEFQAALTSDPLRVWAPQELVDYAVALPPVGAPGEHHVYSNAGYILAAMVAEQAAGAAYAAALRARVIDPAGLAHTWLEAEEQWPDPTAVGYLVVEGDPPLATTGYYHASQAWSAGAIVATVGDLRAWIATLLASDFLAPASQEALVELVPADGLDGYGLGVFAVETADGPIVGHNGAVMGFQAAAYLDPTSASTVAVMVNQLGLDAQGELTTDPTLLALAIVEAIRGG